MYDSCINLSSNTLIEEHLCDYARYVVLGVYCSAVPCLHFELHDLLHASPGAPFPGADTKEVENYNSFPK